MASTHRGPALQEAAAELSVVSAASDEPPAQVAAIATQTRPVTGDEKPPTTASGTDSRTGSGTNSGPSGSSGSGSGAGMSNSDSSNGAPSSRTGRKARKRRGEPASQGAHAGRESGEPSSFRMPEPGSNLFVAGLASTVDDEALRGAFAPHGRVVSAKVMLHVDTAASRGFGFVLFATAAEAEQAMHAVQGTAIAGHGGRLQVSVSKHRGENLTAESRVVYVRNVPAAVGRSAATLAEFFGSFGEVLRQQVSSQPDLPPRPGMKSAGPLTAAVVTFATIEAARACVAACHGKRPFAQCVVPLLSKMEEPQTLRERRMREQRAQRPKKAGAHAAPRAPSSASSGAVSARAKPSSEPRERGDDVSTAGGGGQYATATTDGQPPMPAAPPMPSSTSQGAPPPMPPPQLPPTAPWWPAFGAMPPPPSLFGPYMSMPPNFGSMPPPPASQPGFPGFGGPGFTGWASPPNGPSSAAPGDDSRARVAPASGMAPPPMPLPPTPWNASR